MILKEAIAPSPSSAVPKSCVSFEVSSSPLIKVRVGQTLKVEYRADSGYTITHSWFGANAFYDAFTWAGGTDSISESIKITADMDGATINRETIGIVVEEAG